MGNIGRQHAQLRGPLEHFECLPIRCASPRPVRPMLSGVQPHPAGQDWSMVGWQDIRTKWCDISIPTFIISLCLIVSMYFYSDSQKYEKRVLGIGQDPRRDTYLMNQFLVRAFEASRDTWMALLGALLWAVVARFKALKDSGSLIQPMGGVRPKSTAQRIMWLSLALLCLVIADIPFCRVNYQMTLNANITPAKERLLSGQPGTHCANEMIASATGICIEFCKEAKDLAVQRYEATMWARDWHILGRV